MTHDLIISLTTWKQRIYGIDFKRVMFNLLTHKTGVNYKVVLVLSSDEFSDSDVPEWLVELNNLDDKLEILWTKENTKAYKKYFPTRRKYPDENIMTVDDDSVLKPNALNKLHELMERFPDRFICGSNHDQRAKRTVGQGVRFGFAIYRPTSMFPFDEIEGRIYFKDHDDEFNLLLTTLNGSKYVAVDAWEYLDINCVQQESKLENVTSMQYGNLNRLWGSFFLAHPELKRQFLGNKDVENIIHSSGGGHINDIEPGHYPSFGKKYHGERAVISMTSWKARISTAAKTLFSLIKMCPGFHIVLVLSKEEFPSMMDSLPESVKLFVDNELVEVLWVRTNYKSYKKVMFTMDKYRDVPVISADDDCIYTCNYAQELYDEWEKSGCRLGLISFRKSSQAGCPVGCSLLHAPAMGRLYLSEFKTYRKDNLQDDAFYMIVYKKYNIPFKALHDGFPCVFHDEVNPINGVGNKR